MSLVPAIRRHHFDRPRPLLAQGLLAVGIGACLVAAPGGAAAAQTIKLTDDTTVTADVLQTDDDSVVVRLPRALIATIDGQALPPVLKEGVAAPAFTANDLSGQAHTVDAKQGAVTLLHFWVSWCPFCQADQPGMQALYEQYKDDTRVRVLTVALDEQRAPIDQFITEHQVRYPVIASVAEAAATGAANPAQLYQVNSFPVTYIIDGQGVIRHKVVGSFMKSNMDIAALVNALVPAPVPSAASERPLHAGAEQVVRQP